MTEAVEGVTVTVTLPEVPLLEELCEAPLHPAAAMAAARKSSETSSFPRPIFPRRSSPSSAGHQLRLARRRAAVPRFSAGDLFDGLSLGTGWDIAMDDGPG